MSIAIADPETQPQPRLLTVADVASLPDQLPTGPVKYELDEGKLLIMAPAGDEHSSLQIRIAAELLLQGERKGHGKARTEVGIVLQRGPDVVFEPDAAFIANRSLPLRKSSEGYLETIPEIVVEVRSKNDSMRGLLRKADRYLHAGAQVVWLLDPSSKSIAVCRKDVAPVELRENDLLTAEGIIPGFQVPVADLFRE